MKANKYMFAALALGLAACGNSNPGSEETSKPQDHQTESSTDNHDNTRSLSGINSFEFTMSGDAQKLYNFDEADLRPTGGCGNGAISLGFLDNSKAQQPEFFYFSFEDRDVESGQPTDSIALSDVQLTNGMIMSDQIQRYMPNTFSGEGTLTVHTNEGRGMNGRFSAIVEAQLTNKNSGESANITAKFDINLACRT